MLLTGRQFTALHKPPYIKFIPSNMKSMGFKFVEGLNVDTNHFNPEFATKGGFHFCLLSCLEKRSTKKLSFFVEVPPDAFVFYSEGVAKSNKIIIRPVEIEKLGARIRTLGDVGESTVIDWFFELTRPYPEFFAWWNAYLKERTIKREFVTLLSKLNLTEDFLNSTSSKELLAADTEGILEDQLSPTGTKPTFEFLLENVSSQTLERWGRIFVCVRKVVEVCQIDKSTGNLSLLPPPWEVSEDNEETRIRAVLDLPLEKIEKFRKRAKMEYLFRTFLKKEKSLPKDYRHFNRGDWLVLEEKEFDLVVRTLKQKRKLLRCSRKILEKQYFTEEQYLFLVENLALKNGTPLVIPDYPAQFQKKNYEKDTRYLLPTNSKVFESDSEFEDSSETEESRPEEESEESSSTSTSSVSSSSDSSSEDEPEDSKSTEEPKEDPKEEQKEESKSSDSTDEEPQIKIRSLAYYSEKTGFYDLLFKISVAQLDANIEGLKRISLIFLVLQAFGLPKKFRNFFLEFYSYPLREHTREDDLWLFKKMVYAIPVSWFFDPKTFGQTSLEHILEMRSNPDYYGRVFLFQQGDAVDPEEFQIRLAIHFFKTHYKPKPTKICYPEDFEHILRKYRYPVKTFSQKVLEIAIPQAFKYAMVFSSGEIKGIVAI